MLGLDGSGLEVHLSQCRDSPHKYRLVFTSVDEEQQYSPTEMKEAELELTEGNWHFFAFSVVTSELVILNDNAVHGLCLACAFAFAFASTV